MGCFLLPLSSVLTLIEICCVSEKINTFHLDRGTEMSCPGEVQDKTHRGWASLDQALQSRGLDPTLQNSALTLEQIKE